MLACLVYDTRWLTCALVHTAVRKNLNITTTVREAFSIGFEPSLLKNFNSILKTFYNIITDCTHVLKAVSLFIHMIFGDITLHVRMYGYAINNKGLLYKTL